MSMIAFLMFTYVDFLLFYPIIHYIYIYRHEPNDEPHPNLIKIFKLKLNLIIVKPELELEPCDIA